MEAFLMAANLLYVAAYFTQDILRLRLMTLLAACLLAVYFYSQPTPMYSVVAWNMFFVALNLVQIGRTVRARLALKGANFRLPSPAAVSTFSNGT